MANFLCIHTLYTADNNNSNNNNNNNKKKKKKKKKKKNKQFHTKVLLSSFHLNSHTSGFNPQTSMIEPPCTIIIINTWESTAQ